MVNPTEPNRKTSAVKIAASLLACVLLGACTSSGDGTTSTGHTRSDTTLSARPVTSTPPYISTPSRAVDPCLQLVNKPVGAEQDAKSPNGGHLATPPDVCAKVAALASSAGCYPKGANGNRVGDWFWYTTPAGSILGKPGGMWIAKAGQVNQFKDRKLVDC